MLNNIIFSVTVTLTLNPESWNAKSSEVSWFHTSVWSDDRQNVYGRTDRQMDEGYTYTYHNTSRERQAYNKKYLMIHDLSMDIRKIHCRLDNEVFYLWNMKYGKSKQTTYSIEINNFIFVIVTWWWTFVIIRNILTFVRINNVAN